MEVQLKTQYCKAQMWGGRGSFHLNCGGGLTCFGPAIPKDLLLFLI